MKKLLIPILISIFLFSGCAAKDNDAEVTRAGEVAKIDLTPTPVTSTPTPQITPTPTPEPTLEPTQTATPKPTEKPTPKPTVKRTPKPTPKQSPESSNKKEPIKILHTSPKCEALVGAKKIESGQKLPNYMYTNGKMPQECVECIIRDCRKSD